jgi:hypothetical protein
MPGMTHRSVQQLLEVLGGTARHHRNGTPFPAAYHDAVRDASKRFGVTYQTIGDLCRRRLGLTDITEFMDLLGGWLHGQHEPLQRRIKEQANPGTHGLIDQFFAIGDVGDIAPIALSERNGVQDRSGSYHERPAGPEEIRVRLNPDLAQRLRLAQLAGIGATIEEAAVALLERGFEVERPAIKRFLDRAVGAT